MYAIFHGNKKLGKLPHKQIKIEHPTQNANFRIFPSK